MSNIGPTNPTTKARVIGNCWDYLLENFHKFNDGNKIKICLVICGKDMPTTIEGSSLGTKVIIVKDRDAGKTDNRSLAISKEVPGL